MRNRKDIPGLLPTILESVLERRIFFKDSQKTFVINTNEWHWCEHRIVALKDILVSLYGTTGSEERGKLEGWALIVMIIDYFSIV